MKVSENFDLVEFIDPLTYGIFKENSIWFIDQRIIQIAQFLRTQLVKPVIINNWYNGGQYKESGLRHMGTATGGKFSQHRYGRAADIKVSGVSPAYLFSFVQQRWPEFMKLGLTTVEDIAFTPTWLHLDCRNWGDQVLHVVKP